MNKKQPKPIIKPFAKDMAKEFFKVGIKEWIEERDNTACHEIVATVNLAFAAEVCMKAELGCNRDEGDFEGEKILQTSFILNFSTAVLMALQGVSMQDIVKWIGYQPTKEDLFKLL